MVLAAAAGVSLTGMANAASINSVILSQLVTTPQVLLLEDNDRSYVVFDALEAPPAGGPAIIAGTLSVGDKLRGIIEIQKVGATNIGKLTGNSELTAVFDIVVTGKFQPGGPGTQFTWLFGPDPLFGTYAGDSPALTAAVGAGNPGGAMVAFFEDTPDVVFDSGVAGSGAPAVGNETLISTASDGSLWALLGSGLWATSSQAVIIPGGLHSDALFLPAGAESTPAEGETGLLGPFIYTGPFSTGQFILPVIPVGAVGESVLAGGMPVSSTFSLFGKDADASTLGVLPGEFAFNNFNFSSDADVRIFAVPLPASAWMGMGLLGIMGAVRGLRRR
jgi:hypothetical protein